MSMSTRGKKQVFNSAGDRLAWRCALSSTSRHRMQSRPSRYVRFARHSPKMVCRSRRDIEEMCGVVAAEEIITARRH